MNEINKEMIKKQKEQIFYLFDLMEQMVKMNKTGIDFLTKDLKYTTNTSKSINSIHIVLSSLIVLFQEDSKDILNNLNPDPQELQDFATYTIHYMKLKEGLKNEKNDKS